MEIWNWFSKDKIIWTFISRKCEAIYIKMYRNQKDEMMDQVLLKKLPLLIRLEAD